MRAYAPSGVSHAGCHTSRRAGAGRPNPGLLGAWEHSGCEFEAKRARNAAESTKVHPEQRKMAEAEVGPAFVDPHPAHMPPALAWFTARRRCDMKRPISSIRSVAGVITAAQRSQAGQPASARLAPPPSRRTNRP